MPGSDYTSVNSVLLLSSTNTRRCVNIPIATDSIVENNETFTVELSSTDDDVTYGLSIAIVTILNDDGKPTLAGIYSVSDYCPHSHPQP